MQDLMVTPEPSSSRIDLIRCAKKTFHDLFTIKPKKLSSIHMYVWRQAKRLHRHFYQKNGVILIEDRKPVKIVVEQPELLSRSYTWLVHFFIINCLFVDLCCKINSMKVFQFIFINLSNFNDSPPLAYIILALFFVWSVPKL